jgi:sugar phosphate isomerase/epimerase
MTLSMNDVMNRLSLAPVTINEVDPPELIAAAAAAGFQSVDLRVLGAPGAAAVAPVIGNRPMIAAIAAACADTGVSIFGATGVWLVPSFALEDALPALEVAARLGAEQFLAVGNDPAEARMTDNLGCLAEAAAQHRLRIALELMPYTAVNSLAKAYRLVAACRKANLGLLIDALHLARAGGTPAEVAAIDRQHIGYLQLCDAPALAPAGMALRTESLSSRLYPGEGELPLFALLDALPADVVVDVETPVARDRGLPPAERAARALAATKRLLHAWAAQKPA